MPTTFVRVHRSIIVRLDRISELVPDLHGDYRIRLKTGTEARAEPDVSRSRRGSIRPPLVSGAACYDSRRLLRRLFLITFLFTACASGPTTPTRPPTALTLPLHQQRVADHQRAAALSASQRGRQPGVRFPIDADRCITCSRRARIAAIRGTHRRLDWRSTTSATAVFEPLDTSSCNLRAVGAAVSVGERQRQRRFRSLVVEPARLPVGRRHRDAHGAAAGRALVERQRPVRP